MVGRVRYYPYGGIRTQEGEIPTDKLFTGQPFGWAQDRQRETASGIYHYNARLYNADIGRFPQADTIVPEPQNPAAYNRYSYVENNPVNHTDPTGHGCVASSNYTKVSRTTVIYESHTDCTTGWTVPVLFVRTQLSGYHYIGQWVGIESASTWRFFRKWCRASDVASYLSPGRYRVLGFHYCSNCQPKSIFTTVEFRMP